MLCDKNNSQSLSVSEFLQFCNVARTRVAMRLFSIFDADGTGSLDFRELMVTVWHLCTLDHKGLQALVFDLYDEDNNERLDVEDMTQLLCDCYGDSALTDNPNVKLVLTKVEKKGAMNREQFLKFVQSAPQAMKQVSYDSVCPPVSVVTVTLTTFRPCAVRPPCPVSGCR